MFPVHIKYTDLDDIHLEWKCMFPFLYSGNEATICCSEYSESGKLRFYMLILR